MADPHDHEARTTAFFGLRSAVELFQDPTFPAAVTRAKEAALLYDRIVVEEGMVDVSIGPEGAHRMWVPPELATNEVRARARKVLTTDAGSTTFVAEYHTGILDELEPLEVPWVEAIITEPGSIRSAAAEDRDLLAGRPEAEQDLIVDSFDRDCAVAAELGATFTISPLFAGIAARRGLTSERPGDTALGIVVPNVGQLGWEQIAEFREHPGCEAARVMLRGVEEQAAEGNTEDVHEYLRSVSEEVTNALFEALQDQRPKLVKDAGIELAKFGIEFIPFAGPILEKTATAGQIAEEHHRWRRSWMAALLKLRGNE